MDIFDLSAIIRLDSSQYESKLASLGDGIKTAAKAGAVAFGAASAATVAFGGSAVEAGMSFDKSMAQVAATMGKTMDDMDTEVGHANTSFGEFDGTLREFAQFMGANTAFSATQAADALNYMALAGYKTQESMDMLPNVLNLASAGNMDLARASDMVTDAQTALGLSFDETSVMVDQLAKASSTTNTSVEQLGDAFLTVGATARSVKGGTQEMATVMGILADNGIKGSEAGTHFRNIMQRIVKMDNPTKKMAQAMDELGISSDFFYDTAGNMRDLPSIFQDLDKAMAGKSAREKDSLISMLFNQYDLSAVNSLLGTSTERWEEVGAAIDDAAGSADQMAKTQLDNLAGDITLFKSALEGAQIAVSDQLTPAIRKFVQFGTKGLSDLTMAFQDDGLEGAMEVFQDLVTEGAEMIVEGIPQIISAGGQLLLALGRGIVGAIPSLGVAAIEIVQYLADGIITGIPNLMSSAESMILGFVNSVTLHAPELLSSGVEIVNGIVSGIVNGIPALLTGAQNLLANLIISFRMQAPMLLSAGAEIVVSLSNGLLQSLPTLIKSGGDILASLIEFVYKEAGSFLDGGMAFIENLGNGVMANLPFIVKSINDTINKLIETISNSYPEFLSKGADFIVKMATGIANNLPTILNAITSILQNLIVTLANHLPEFLSKGVEIIGRMAMGILQNLPAIMSAITNMVVRLIATLASNLPQFLSKGIEIVGRMAAGIISAIPTIVSGAISMIANLASQFTSYDWLSVGTNILAGIRDGILNGAQWLINAAIQVASDVYHEVLRWFGIESPSKLMRDKVGKNISLGWAKGIEEGTPEVVDAMQDTADDMLEVVPDEIPFADTEIKSIDTPDKPKPQGGFSFAPIFNIYASEEQDVEELADLVMERMTFMYERERAAYGTS